MSRYGPEKDPLMWRMIEGIISSIMVILAVVLTIAVWVWDKLIAATNGR